VRMIKPPLFSAPAPPDRGRMSPEVEGAGTGVGMVEAVIEEGVIVLFW